MIKLLNARYVPDPGVDLGNMGELWSTVMGVLFGTIFPIVCTLGVVLILFFFAKTIVSYAQADDPGEKKELKNKFIAQGVCAFVLANLAWLAPVIINALNFG